MNRAKKSILKYIHDLFIIISYIISISVVATMIYVLIFVTTNIDILKLEYKVVFILCINMVAFVVVNATILIIKNIKDGKNVNKVNE